MPTAVRRKSSLSTTRRANQKYIPYGGDDFQRGKRTGIPVAYIDHSSDGFEPFEQLIDQADQRTPPRPKVQKKKKPKTPIVEEESDEYGEMDMSLEESTPNSPAAYFMSSKVASLSTRVGSSLNYSPDVNFDEIPSPRPSSSRKSIGNSMLSRGPGPSRLSRAFRADDFEDIGQDLPYDEEGYDDPPEEVEPDDGGIPLPPSSPPVPTPRRKSFKPFEDQDEGGSRKSDRLSNGHERTPSSSKSKGKQRAIEQDEDEDVNMEDDIARGMEEVDMQVDEEDEGAEDDQETPKAKKTRGREVDDSAGKDGRPEKKKARFEKKEKKPSRSKKENVLREVIQDRNVDDSGLRRGARVRYAPLDWWRNEKVVYGRRGSGGACLVPSIKEIRRIPKEEPQPLGKHAKKRGRSIRSRSKTVEVQEEEDLDLAPEDGWDDETTPDGIIAAYPDGEDVQKRVAFTARMVNPRPAANNDFFFQKVFGDGDFIAAGQLIIPPKKSKPTKGTKDNTFVFYVIEGAVTVKIHRTSFVVANGGMFMVPRGNMYFIQNISDRDARLFFAQARKVVEDENDARSSRFSQSRSPSRTTSRGPEGRASSKGKKTAPT